MDNIVIQDVFEVYLKDLADSTKVYFIGTATETEITQTVRQEMLRGGIGNGIKAVLQSEKTIEFTVTNLFHLDSFYEIQSGTTFQPSTTVTVQKTESGTLSGGKIQITGTPTGTSVLVFDKYGKSYTGTYDSTAKTVTITGGVEGDVYTVIYPAQVTAQVLPLMVDKFPKAYYVELHTIAYAPDTNTVVADIFWQFNKCIPDGGMKATLRAGQNETPQIKFTVLAPTGSNQYGQYVIVPRT